MTDAIADPETDQTDPEAGQTESEVESPKASKPSPKSKTRKQVEKDLETLEPEVKRREQRVHYLDAETGQTFDRVYVQQKLAFFPKIELTAILGEALDYVMETDDGAVLTLLGENETSINSFIKIISKVATQAPDLIKRIYMVTLGVPRHERSIVGDIFDLPHDDKTHAGGLSDDDGFAILQLLFEQNGKTIRDFFLERLPKMIETARTNLSLPQTQD